MAPSIVETSLPTTVPTKDVLSKLYLPTTPTTNLRTSGQHEPLFDKLTPYSEFPKEITGPTAWERSDFVDHPEKWVYWWTEADIAEIDAAVEGFVAAGVPLTTISKESFPLPTVGQFLSTVREDLTNDKGFILFKGFPVERWGLHKSAIAYMGIGTHIGHIVSQNSHGHVLGHVQDLGEDSTQTDKVRIYRTNARQFFHCDDSDIVGLLCISRALSGGESDIVSSHRVFNVLQRTRPDVVEALTRPNWYFDRKGETSRGQKEWIRGAVMYYYHGRVVTKWDPYYVTSLSRFSDVGLVPGLSVEQKEALKVLEETCGEEALHMVLKVGDIQFVTNNFMFHARTEYIDPAPPAPRRHLMRLWLSTPEREGGWKLPFPDSGRIKRGGIQVDDTPEKAPLVGE
ncbi:taurine catabolism dioxygenase TauD, TfdA family protein [Wilcoxina mikolae CBS 423.85]|nr:taurine catabolism dioxygenase TauD, TfdA family protein [Wilcoxina mikolae CBS 423.85]